MATDFLYLKTFLRIIEKGQLKCIGVENFNDFEIHQYIVCLPQGPLAVGVLESRPSFFSQCRIPNVTCYATSVYPLHHSKSFHPSLLLFLFLFVSIVCSLVFQALNDLNTVIVRSAAPRNLRRIRRYPSIIIVKHT